MEFRSILLDMLMRRFGTSERRRRRIWVVCTGLLNGVVLGFCGWCLGSLLGWERLSGWNAAGIFVLGCILGLHSAYRQSRSTGFRVYSWPGEGPGR